MITRRAFLKSSGLAAILIGSGAAPMFIPRAAEAATLSASSKKRRVLVCLFQRGAMDGLMAVSPFTDQYFINARNRLRMNVGGDNGLIDLDGRFALHPALKPLQPLFNSKQLAIVHGVGSPDNTRSHFDAQDYMENGTPGKKSGSGWLNRASSLLAKAQSPFQSVAMTPALPLSLVGEHPALAIDDLKNFRVNLPGASPALTSGAASGFEALYQQTSQRLLRGAGQESFDAMKLLDKANLRNYTPASGANYPPSALGNHLKQVAQLIKADVGVEIAFVESTGWDTHVQQGTVNGQFGRMAAELAAAVSAFWRDVETMHNEVVLMTMTEFGRTVRENGSGGTDHGRASCMFVLGQDIDGGRIHGSIPTLATENLADGRDVPVTTDFRSLFSAVAGHHLNISKDETLFPGWTGQRLAIWKKS